MEKEECLLVADVLLSIIKHFGEDCAEERTGFRLKLVSMIRAHFLEFTLVNVRGDLFMFEQREVSLRTAKEYRPDMEAVFGCCRTIYWDDSSLVRFGEDSPETDYMRTEIRCFPPDVQRILETVITYDTPLYIHSKRSNMLSSVLNSAPAAMEDLLKISRIARKEPARTHNYRKVLISALTELGVRDFERNTDYRIIEAQFCEQLSSHYNVLFYINGCPFFIVSRDLYRAIRRCYCLIEDMTDLKSIFPEKFVLHLPQETPKYLIFDLSVTFSESAYETVHISSLAPDEKHLIQSLFPDTHSVRKRLSKKDKVVELGNMLPHLTPSSVKILVSAIQEFGAATVQERTGYRPILARLCPILKSMRGSTFVLFYHHNSPCFLVSNVLYEAISELGEETELPLYDVFPRGRFWHLSPQDPQYVLFDSNQEYEPSKYEMVGISRLQSDAIEIINALFPDGIDSILIDRLCGITRSSIEDEGFWVTYQGKQHVIYDKLATAIGERFAQYSLDAGIKLTSVQNVTYSPMAHLSNTSGSGKTRASLELGDLTTVLYMKFGKANGLAESVVTRRIVDFVCSLRDNRHMDELYIIMDIIIQRLLRVCLKYVPEPETKAKTRALFAEYAVKGLSNFGLDLSVLFEGLTEMSIPLSLLEKRHDQLVESFFDYSTFPDLLPKWPKDVTDWPEESFEEMVKHNVTCLNGRRRRSDLPSLIIVLDEAHLIISEKDFGEFPLDSDVIASDPIRVVTKYHKATTDEKVEIILREVDFYHLFRGCLRYSLFYWLNSLTLTVSTVSNVLMFYPAPKNDSSFRLKPHINFNHLPPIVFEGTYNVFSYGAFKAGDFEDWNVFLFGHTRILTIGSLGRPLFAVNIGVAYMDRIRVLKTTGDTVSDQLAPFETVPHPFNVLSEAAFSEPKLKLSSKAEIGVADWAAGKGEVSVPMNEFITTLTLLAVAIGLEKLPSFIRHEDLVSNHGMCLLSVDHERNVTGYYPSEGVFNGVAAHHLIQLFSTAVSTLKIIITRFPPVFSSIGEFGELIERLWLLKRLSLSGRGCVFQRFKRPVSIEPRTLCEYIFEPVGLEDFLTSLVGRETSDQLLSATPDLRGSFLAFNHFTSMTLEYIKSPADVMATYLSMGAACIPRRGSVGVDLMIPLVLQTGKMSFIYVQTKTGPSYEKNASLTDIADSSPLKTFGAFTDPCLYLYHHITSESAMQSSVLDYVVSKKGAPPRSGKCLFIRGLEDTSLSMLTQLLYTSMQESIATDSNASIALASKNPKESNAWKSRGQPDIDHIAHLKMAWNNATLIEAKPRYDTC